MLLVSDLRKVEVLQNSGEWVEVQSLGQIEKGDVFRVFESDGEPLLNEDGGAMFIALNEASVDAESYKVGK